MTEQMDIDKAIRELADDVLATRSSALSASGLRATMEVEEEVDAILGQNPERPATD